MDTMSIDNSFDEFCCKRQLGIESGSWREVESSEEFSFKDRYTVACVYTDENDLGEGKH